MAIFQLQVADINCYRDKSVLRIYRLGFWRWWWIWSRVIVQPKTFPPTYDGEAWEQIYMDRHPDIWPPEPVKPKRKPRAKAANGSAA